MRVPVIATFWLIILYLAPASAQTPFLHEGYGFKLSVPSGFTFSRDPHPGVGVLVAPIEGGYPTFNVLLAQGEFRVTQRRAALEASKLVDEYRAVGLNDAELKGFEIELINSRPALKATISYHYSGQPLVATVWKVEGEFEHLILTLISDPLSKQRSPLKDKLLPSFQLLVKSSSSPPPVSGSYTFIITGLVLVGVLIVAGSIWARSRTFS